MPVRDPRRVRTCKSVTYVFNTNDLQNINFYFWNFSFSIFFRSKQKIFPEKSPICIQTPSVLFHRKSPPFFLRFWKEGGAFPETAKIFRFWFAFTVGNALKCFGNECFSIEKLQFWELFLKKIAPAARSFRIPTTSNNPRRSENATVQIRSSVILYRRFQRFLHLEIAVKAPQARKFWRKNSNNNDFR